MKIQRAPAVLVLLACALLFSPQQAKANPFYIRFDFGHPLYSFYPYDYNFWPVYDDYFYSTSFYYYHLYYYFPLIGYYQPVYYSPLVPYRLDYLNYPTLFYYHVYSYYRYRPYVYRRYYSQTGKTGKHGNRHYTYSRPDKYHGHGPAKTGKHYYSNHDFMHLRQSNTWRQDNSHHQHQGKAAEIAERLINRNRGATYRHSRQIGRQPHDRHGNKPVPLMDSRRLNRQEISNQRRERDYRKNFHGMAIANTRERPESTVQFKRNYITNTDAVKDRETGFRKRHYRQAPQPLSTAPVRSYDRQAATGRDMPDIKRHRRNGKHAPSSQRRMQGMKYRHR